MNELLSQLSFIIASFGDAGAVFIPVAASMGILLVLGIVISQRGYQRRRDEARVAQKKNSDAEAGRRIYENEGLRTRMVGLERAIEELRQAAVARAALDAALPPPPPMTAAPAAPSGPVIERPRALVCAKDETVARVLQSLVAARGFDADRCRDGIDAAALASKTPPALILFDAEAGGGEAAVLTRALASKLASGGRLFVLGADEALAKAARAAGGEALPAPIDFVALARLIRGGSAAQGVAR